MMEVLASALLKLLSYTSALVNFPSESAESHNSKGLKPSQALKPAGETLWSQCPPALRPRPHGNGFLAG